MLIHSMTIASSLNSILSISTISLQFAMQSVLAELMERTEEGRDILAGISQFVEYVTLCGPVAQNWMPMGAETRRRQSVCHAPTCLIQSLVFIPTLSMSPSSSTPLCIITLRGFF